MLLYVILAITALLTAAVLIISYVCYRMAFYAEPKPALKDGEFDLPEGKMYEPYWPLMEEWARQFRSLPHEEFSIESFDGLRLYGKYYEFAPGAPVELMFHGYRGTAERDLSGGVHRCFRLGRSALVVDQRCSGKSDGHVISFGINERRDCLKWIDFAISHFGKDVKLILTGISMGASTVLMAAGQKLPENVIGVLADCGFNSAKDIIGKVIGDMGLPKGPSYPFVKLGARLYGHFDLEEYSAEKAMESCTVPTIFFHGEADDFVPWEMSRINYERCIARKKLVIIPGAAHGLSFPAAPELYLEALREFFGPEASYPGFFGDNKSVPETVEVG